MREDHAPVRPAQFRHLSPAARASRWSFDAVGMIHARGFWLEVVTLLIPGFNDSREEIRDIAQFLCAVSPDIPWHVTAFHPDYKMTDRHGTPVRTVLRAAELGRAEGLRHVYAGNIPGAAGPFENTWCPSCGPLLVERVPLGMTMTQAPTEKK